MLREAQHYCSNDSNTSVPQISWYKKPDTEIHGASMAHTPGHTSLDIPLDRKPERLVSGR